MLQVILGLLLAGLSGIFGGSYALPMKKTKEWAWENVWVFWALVGLLISPWILALWTVPSLFSVLADSGFKALAMALVFGGLWGLGSVLFGRSIAILGMSLSYAISLGLTIAIGSLIDLVKKPELFASKGGQIVTVGVAIMVLGVIVSAVAGNLKEKKTASSAPTEETSGKPNLFMLGMIICVISGFFNPMINFAFVFGDKILDTAVAGGASEGNAPNAVWAVALFGGLVTNLIYCFMLLSKNKTWPNYKKAGTSHYPALSGLMGLLWFLSLATYGVASVKMGPLGKSAGFAIYIGGCIFVSNFWGILTGEWKEGKGKPLNVMIGALLLLLIAMVVIGIGNYL